MFEIIQYTAEYKDTWNKFLETSKNGTFMFDRNYMDYHADRFKDNSLMVFRKGCIYAVLPANRDEDTLYSHQGLTYGGLITNKKATTSEILEVFELLKDFLSAQGIKHVIYKPIPHIYHNIPAEEDLYALFRCTNARIIARNISSTIRQDNKIKFTESRKSGIRKAQRNGLVVTESTDLESFWEILSCNLKNKYDKKPVHTLEEIKMLTQVFPNNIKLYLTKDADNKPLGGTLIYITNSQTIHTQYISASQKGKDIGALDILFDHLINVEYKNYPIFDFGHSTEEMGTILNNALIFQKEGFGGRGVLYDTYQFDL